jgi:fucose 4-O-acetylase-like acetyltransferase
VSAADRTATGREGYLDNLKVVLIGAIIVIHAVLGYAGLVQAWTYTELRETTLSPVTELVVFVVAAPFGFFLIGLLFLVAGLFTAPSMERKGVSAYTRERLLRLGVPYVAYVLIVQPTVTYLLGHPLGDAPGTYWQEYLAEGRSHRLDSGPLWFVGTLLIFSLGYAVWVALRGPGRLTGPVSARWLWLLAALVALISFGIRVVAPYGSEAGVLDLNYWQWPGCLAAFCLGIVAAPQDWVRRVPVELARRCRAITMIAIGLMFALLLIAGARDVVETELLGGPHVLALGFSVIDAVLVVFGPVWLLDVARRRLRGRLPRGEALSRSAFGAFILQTPVLIGLAMALRPVGIPAEAKALVVAAGGVALSYGLAHLLVSRVPGADRIL